MLWMASWYIWGVWEEGWGGEGMGGQKGEGSEREGDKGEAKGEERE